MLVFFSLAFSFSFFSIFLHSFQCLCFLIFHFYFSFIHFTFSLLSSCSSILLFIFLSLVFFCVCAFEQIARNIHVEQRGKRTSTYISQTHTSMYVRVCVCCFALFSSSTSLARPRIELSLIYWCAISCLYPVHNDDDDTRCVQLYYLSSQLFDIQFRSFFAYAFTFKV